MSKWIVLAFCIISTAFAQDLAKAPAAFIYNGDKAVYVDFTKAEYTIRYDITLQQASVTAKMDFVAPIAGFPIFDVVNDPTSVKLDGVEVGQVKIQTPDRASFLRVTGVATGPGVHSLEVKVPLTTLVEWSDGGVKSAFWTTDLQDRGYLERYLPANMEYDRVPMTFIVEFIGATREQTIYSNGVVSRRNDGATVTFPANYTTNSVFFHTVPFGSMAESRSTYRSVDGRELPVTIYMKPPIFGDAAAQLAALKQQTEAVIAELEADYGPFLHNSITVYNAGSGGMEYCGATMTSSSALGHELTHSYFARGVMPANGNAGWLDEAIASWRDKGYRRATSISGSANMAGRASYTRFTDQAAYSYGANFMAYLDGKFADQGGLKALLRRLAETKAFTPLWTEDFIAAAEGQFRMSLRDEFQRRVYQSGLIDKNKKWKVSPHHQQMTLEQLKEHL